MSSADNHRHTCTACRLRLTANAGLICTRCLTGKATTFRYRPERAKRIGMIQTIPRTRRSVIDVGH